MTIPNVMDFDHPPQPPDDYTATFRPDVGLNSGEYLFLQPTRVVQRKGIEHAIELIQRIGLKARLIISHASGDEGYEYEQRLRYYSELMGVSAYFVSDIIRDSRGSLEDGRKIYTLWDAYQAADLVTYPSSTEGFGNAFLEAIYYHRPIVVNNYSIFAIDIKPIGFHVVEFDGFITEDTVKRVVEILEDKRLAQQMTEHNYSLAKRHYSFSMLERRLNTLLMECFGEE